MGVEEMTVGEVKGFGRQKREAEIYRGAEHTLSFLLKVKIKTAVDDGAIEQIVEAITQEALIGNIVDGELFVCSLGSDVRMRTGEFNCDELQKGVFDVCIKYTETCIIGSYFSSGSFEHNEW